MPPRDMGLGPERLWCSPGVWLALRPTLPHTQGTREEASEPLPLVLRSACGTFCSFSPHWTSMAHVFMHLQQSETNKDNVMISSKASFISVKG